MKRKICGMLLCIALAASAAGTALASEAEPPAIDLDLSAYSGTLVYAQVFNMMSEPEAYLGQIIRMAGYYSAYQDPDTGMVYHACVIPDATACCAQGIEFVWAGEHAWPEDYPEEFTDIVVTGRLEMYEEDGYTYLHLNDSEVTWEAADGE